MKSVNEHQNVLPHTRPPSGAVYFDMRLVISTSESPLPRPRSVKTRRNCVLVTASIVRESKVTINDYQTGAHMVLIIILEAGLDQDAMGGHQSGDGAQDLLSRLLQLRRTHACSYLQCRRRHKLQCRVHCQVLIQYQYQYQVDDTGTGVRRGSFSRFLVVNDSSTSSENRT
jgi:hypothetical protein